MKTVIGLLAFWSYSDSSHFLERKGLEAQQGVELLGGQVLEPESEIVVLSGLDREAGTGDLGSELEDFRRELLLRQVLVIFYDLVHEVFPDRQAIQVDSELLLVLREVQEELVQVVTEEQIREAGLTVTTNPVELTVDVGLHLTAAGAVMQNEAFKVRAASVYGGYNGILVTERVGLRHGEAVKRSELLQIKLHEVPRAIPNSQQGQLRLFVVYHDSVVPVAKLEDVTQLLIQHLPRVSNIVENVPEEIGERTTRATYVRSGGDRTRGRHDPVPFIEEQLDQRSVVLLVNSDVVPVEVVAARLPEVEEPIKGVGYKGELSVLAPFHDRSTTRFHDRGGLVGHDRPVL